MAEFFIVISPMMLHNPAGLLKLYTATLSSVLSGPGIFPGIHKIPKAEVFNNVITCTNMQEVLSVLLHLKKKN